MTQTTTLASKPDLGALPEWNLADLYSGMDAPELTADLGRAASLAVEFESKWRGTLAAEAGRVRTASSARR